MQFDPPSLNHTNSEPLLRRPVGASMRKSSRRYAASPKVSNGSIRATSVTVPSQTGLTPRVPNIESPPPRTASSISHVSTRSSLSNGSAANQFNPHTSPGTQAEVRAVTSNSPQYYPLGDAESSLSSAIIPGSVPVIGSNIQTSLVSQAPSPATQFTNSGPYQHVHSPEPHVEVMTTSNHPSDWSPSIHGHGSDGTSSPEADPFDVFGPGSEMSHAHFATAVGFELDRSCGASPYDSIGFSTFNFEYFPVKSSSELNTVPDAILSSHVSECSNTPTLQSMEPIYHSSGAAYTHSLDVGLAHVQQTRLGSDICEANHQSETSPSNPHYVEGVPRTTVTAPVHGYSFYDDNGINESNLGLPVGADLQVHFPDRANCLAPYGAIAVSSAHS